MIIQLVKRLRAAAADSGASFRARHVESDNASGIQDFRALTAKAN
jgi:hypothetical protein